MNEPRLPSNRQVRIKWLMILVLVAAVDFWLARTLSRERGGDRASVTIFVLAFDGFLYVAQLAIASLLKMRRTLRRRALFVELICITVLLVFAGLPLTLAVILIVGGQG